MHGGRSKGWRRKQKRRKKDEELEKQKQLGEECAKDDADSKLSKVLDRLDTLEGVVKEIVDVKRKDLSSDIQTKEEVVKKDETSLSKASDLESSASDSRAGTIKSKDTNGAVAANAPARTAQTNSKGNGDKASPAESKS